MKKIILMTIVIVLAVIPLYFMITNWDGKKSEGYDDKNRLGVLNESDLSNGEKKRYVNEEYDFEFMIPQNVTVVSTVENETTLLSAKDGSDMFLFQILIRNIDEEFPVIDTERIKKDLPDISMDQAQEVALGTNGKGTAFISKKDSGETREVWFALNYKLYQLTAPIENDSLVRELLNSWVFK